MIQNTHNDLTVEMSEYVRINEIEKRLNKDNKRYRMVLSWHHVVKRRYNVCGFTKFLKEHNTIYNRNTLHTIQEGVCC